MRKLVRESAAVLVILALATTGTRGEEGHDNDEEEKKGPHGGHVVEIGDPDDTHAELLRDPEKGTLTLHLLGKDRKTAVAIKDAPKINLKLKDDKKQIEMKPVEAKEEKASQFTAEDETLKGEHIDGRIAIQLADGKKYNVPLDPKHGDHGDHKH